MATKRKKNGPAKKAAPARKARKAAAKPVPDPLDLSEFPPESIVRQTRWLCLACTLDIFTRHLGVAADQAWREIKQYQPAAAELASEVVERPYYKAAGPHAACPYAGAATKWQAPLSIVRIEGGKATDALRRRLVKRLPKGGQFFVVEEKSTRREALYEWLAKTSAAVDLSSDGWLMDAARHWLGRRLPKEDWTGVFSNLRVVRRSQRLAKGYEEERGLLFLAPLLFDEVLLMQYLLSRSHLAGGLTFDGRLTLQGLYLRLRRGGYLRAMGVTTGNPGDALEQLMERLGGEETLKFHYLVDRRAFLEQLAKVRGSRIPRPKLANRQGRFVRTGTFRQAVVSKPV